MNNNPTPLPMVIVYSDYVATYVTEDLAALIGRTRLNLAKEFQVPASYFSPTMSEARQTQEILAMLHEDIAHMLRDGLITGIHLILSDDTMDKGSNTYLVRYHAYYQVDLDPQNTTPVTPGILNRQNGVLSPPAGVGRGARFSLFIDWSNLARNRRERICRPDYIFDWATSEEHFDAIREENYRMGWGHDMAHVIVTRTESAPLEHHH